MALPRLTGNGGVVVRRGCRQPYGKQSNWTENSVTEPCWDKRGCLTGSEFLVTDCV